MTKCFSINVTAIFEMKVIWNCIAVSVEEKKKKIWMISCKFAIWPIAKLKADIFGNLSNLFYSCYCFTLSIITVPFVNTVFFKFFYTRHWSCCSCLVGYSYLSILREGWVVQFFILWYPALKELLIIMLSKVTKKYCNLFQKYKPSSPFVPTPFSRKAKMLCTIPFPQ